MGRWRFRLLLGVLLSWSLGCSGSGEPVRNTEQLPPTRFPQKREPQKKPPDQPDKAPKRGPEL